MDENFVSVYKHVHKHVPQTKICINIGNSKHY